METTTAGAGLGGVLGTMLLAGLGMWQQGTGHSEALANKANEFTVIVEALKEGTIRQQAMLDRQADGFQQSYQALLHMCVPK